MAANSELWLNAVSYWPAELWRILRELADQSQQPNRRLQEQVRLSQTKCPQYFSPVEYDVRRTFNEGLRDLDIAGIIRVEWARNSSSRATRIRLLDAGRLELILEQYGPDFVHRANRAPFDMARFMERAQAAFDRWGPMGLRTLAHITLGDSHALDGNGTVVRLLNESSERVWTQVDAVTQGANVVRVAGQISLVLPEMTYGPRWTRPGHYVWEWDVETLGIENVGARLILIENPYPFWEILSRHAQGKDTLVCLHGETRHHRALDSALAMLLVRFFQFRPGLETLIWCDPDPGGLVMATHAFHFVEAHGGIPRFWRMASDVLSQIESVVLADAKFQPLDEDERVELESEHIHAHLDGLRRAILERGIKGEQEGLALLPYSA